MTTKDSFDAKLSVVISSTQQCVVSKNSTNFLQSIEKLIQTITNGHESSLIGPQDFIKMVSMVRDSVCASSSVLSYDDPAWVSLRQQLFHSIGSSAKLAGVKAPFKGSIYEIIDGFGNLCPVFSINDMQSIISKVAESPLESTSKFDLLKFELVLIYALFGVDYLYSTRRPSDSSLEQQLLPALSAVGTLIDKLITSSLSEDPTIRSRRFKSIQKTLQGFLALFDGFRSPLLQARSIYSILNACVNNMQSLMPELSIWDNILKSIFTSIKRIQTLKNENESYSLMLESMDTFLIKLNGIFPSFSTLRKDGNASSGDLVKIIVYVVQLLADFSDSTTSKSANHFYQARLFWQTAKMLQSSQSSSICPFVANEYYEKLHKLVQCCGTHSIFASQQSQSVSITNNEAFLSTDVPLLYAVLGYIWQDARSTDNASRAYSTNCVTLSVENFLQVFSLSEASQTMKKMVSLMLDILLLPKIPNSSEEDLKLVRRDIQSLVTNSGGKKLKSFTQEEECIMTHVVSWWNEDILLLRYSSLSSISDLSSWVVSPTTSATNTGLVAFPASYLGTTHLSIGLSQEQQQEAMASSVDAINVLRYMESLWLNHTDILTTTRSQLDSSSSEWTTLTECLFTMEKYISKVRNELSNSKNKNEYRVSPLWEAKEAQQSFLSLLEAATEQVKPALFQPYVDYYLVKSWIWLLGSKVMWFAFDNLLQAEICVKKSFSYAHNRSVQDTILSRWLRVETLLFQGDIVENLGKTSRAVECIVDAWSIAMPTNTPSESRISSKLSILVFSSALRHWVRIESTRLQTLVSNHIQDPAVLDVVLYLSSISPAFQSHLQKYNWSFIGSNNYCPDVLPDLEILWQQSVMLAPNSSSEASMTGISKQLSTPKAMLAYSLQCPFPLTRHLRKQASIQLALLSTQEENPVNHKQRIYQSFVAGASSSFVTLERHSGHAGGVSESVSLVHKALTAEDTCLDDDTADNSNLTLFHWLNSLTRFPDIPEKNPLPMQVMFLTFDAASDQILAGVLRHTDRDTEDTHVEVQSLPGSGRALQTLTRRWKDMLQHHHDLLRVAKDLTTVTQMTKQEKLQWWKQRERMEEDIEGLLRECETLLAPLLSFLFPFLASTKKYRKIETENNYSKPPTTASKANPKRSSNKPIELELFNDTETIVPKSTKKKASVVSSAMKVSQHKKRSKCRFEDNDDDEEEEESQARKGTDRTKSLTSSMKQLRFFDDEEIGFQNDESRDYDAQNDDNDDEFDRLVATANDHEDDNDDLPFLSEISHVLQSPSSPKNTDPSPSASILLQQQYEAMKVNDLKLLCKERGVSVTGKKSELIERLLSDNAKTVSVGPPATSTSTAVSKKTKSLAVPEVALPLPPPPLFPSSSKSLCQATPSKASLQPPPLSVKKAPLTATKASAIAPLTTMSVLKTAAKKPTTVSSFLVTAQKSAGKRLIDVFQDDEDDHDDALSHHKHRHKHRLDEEFENETAEDDPVNGRTTMHTVLLLDEQLQQLPVECIPALKKASISRMLSLPLLVDILRRKRRQTTPETVSEKRHSKTKQQTPAVSDTRLAWTMPTVSAAKGWFSLDAENNLPTTRVSLLPLLQEAQLRWQWPGYIGEIPSPETAGAHQRSQDVFVYCGHGAGVAFHGLSSLSTSTSSTSSEVTSALPAAFLWGCSSGRLLSRGEHDPTGPALQYFLAGAPLFLLGNLWDVTDRDLDRLTAEVMKQLFALTANMGGDDNNNAFVASNSLQSTKKVLFQDDEEDEDDVDQNKDTGNKGKPTTGVANDKKNNNKKKISAQDTLHVSQCLAKARDVCKMRFAVGAAAVVYGIPVHIDV